MSEIVKIKANVAEKIKTMTAKVQVTNAIGLLDVAIKALSVNEGIEARDKIIEEVKSKYTSKFVDDVHAYYRDK